LRGIPANSGRYKMEPSTLFAGLVGAVGALHLLTRGVNFAQKFFFGADSRQQHRTKTKRSDWYVFFAWSDLVGSDAVKNAPSKRDDDGVGARVVSAPRKTVRKQAPRPAARLVVQ